MLTKTHWPYTTKPEDMAENRNFSSRIGKKWGEMAALTLGDREPWPCSRIQHKASRGVGTWALMISSLTLYHWATALPISVSATWPRWAVGNVSGNRCEFDCRSRVGSSIPAPSHAFVEIDFEIISTVILLPSAESFKKGLLSVTSKSMCTKYGLTACSSLSRKKRG